MQKVEIVNAILRVKALEDLPADVREAAAAKAEGNALIETLALEAISRLVDLADNIGKIAILLSAPPMMTASLSQAISPIPAEIVVGDVMAAALAAKDVLGVQRAREIIARTGASNLNALKLMPGQWNGFLMDVLGSISIVAQNAQADFRQASAQLQQDALQRIKAAETEVTSETPDPPSASEGEVRDDLL